MTTIEDITLEDEESGSQVDDVPIPITTSSDIVTDTLCPETTISPVDFVTSVSGTEWSSQIAEGLRVDFVASEIRGLVEKGQSN